MSIELQSTVYIVAFLAASLGATLAVRETQKLLKETRMFGLGKSQLIAIGGGILVVVGGFIACMVMEPTSRDAFLAFAGPFSWKVIVGATGGAALIKTAANLRGNGK